MNYLLHMAAIQSHFEHNSLRLCFVRMHGLAYYISACPITPLWVSEWSSCEMEGEKNWAIERKWYHKSEILKIHDMGQIH